MAETFTLEIYTPRRLFLSGPVEMLILTIADGEIGVQAGHTNITAPVKCCVARIKEAGAWKIAFVSDGIIEVKRDKTVILTDAAEWPEEIDREQVILSKKTAEETLKSASFNFETSAAKRKIKRAEIRLKALDSLAEPQGVVG
jgi:F-type H+-transporting ATPase subunit epsilon